MEVEPQPAMMSAAANAVINRKLLTLFKRIWHLCRDSFEYCE